MNPQLSIRIATEADTSLIREIATLTWPDTYGSIISQEQIDYMLQWMYSDETLQKQMREGHRFYMAELDGTAYGFAGVSDEKNALFKLHKLYVIPTTQKTGAGKALLQQVIGFAKENGGRRLQLQVNRHNNARGFYEKQGFVIIGEQDFDIGNGYFMNDYVMELAL